MLAETGQDLAGNNCLRRAQEWEQHEFRHLRQSPHSQAGAADRGQKSKGQESTAAMSDSDQNAADGGHFKNLFVHVRREFGSETKTTPGGQGANPGNREEGEICEGGGEICEDGGCTTGSQTNPCTR